MGDSWDETSVEVSEADVFAAGRNTDDLDADLFGGLGGGPKKGPSLLQAMKSKTGKGLFDEEKKQPPAAAAAIAKPVSKPAAKPAAKPVAKVSPPAKAKSPDDDLLADLLSESDYSEVSNRKPAPSTPAKAATPKASAARTPARTPTATPPTGRTPKGPTPRPQDKLFDDDDELSGMLDSEPIAAQPVTRNPPASASPAARGPSSAPETKGSRFSSLLSRTSIMKDEEPVVSSTPPLQQRASTAPGNRTAGRARGEPATPGTPQRGPGPRGGGGGGVLDDSLGFTPSFFSSGGGRSRRGLNSGTPASRPPRPEDTFSALLDEDEEELVGRRVGTPPASKPRDIDIFRVDNKPTTPAARSLPGEDIFRTDNKPFTPAARSVASEDIFGGGVATPDKPRTPARGAGGGAGGGGGGGADGGVTEDIFRTDNKPLSSAITDMFRGTGTPERRGTPPQQHQERPHTQAGGGGELSSSRPPSAGRRANTAPRASPAGEVHTPQRRLSESDSIFGGEEEVAAAPASASRALPWETATADTPPATAPQASSGQASNPALEAKIVELEKQKERLEGEISALQTKTSGEEARLLKERSELREKVEGLERALSDRESEMDSLRKSLKKAEGEVREVEDRVAAQHRSELDQQARRHKETIDRLNLSISEKENIIQTEIRGATKRLQEKEERALEEQRSIVRQWEGRVQETETLYRTRISDLERDHRIEIETLKQRHESDVEEQRRQRKEEVCAVLSVSRTSETLEKLTEKVNLSAEEVANLTAKLDLNRTVTLEERERAARVMSEYLHDLKCNLDSQGREISEERTRLQEIVGRMESHLREQTRQSAAAQNKLLTEEARLRSLQAAWEADKAEEERRLETAREQVERAREVAVKEQRENLERLYLERKEITRERSRVACESQRATEQVARDAVRQLDTEAQAHAMLDKAKRDVSQIEAERELWDKEHHTRQIFVESLQKEKKELKAEKKRLSDLAERLTHRAKETEGYSEALVRAKQECVAVQKQLARLEADLRMREDEMALKERSLKERATALAAEKELLRSDRDSLNSEGVQCPACLKYRPRQLQRATSPAARPTSPPVVKSPQRSPLGMSPLSPLNLSNLSNGSFTGARHNYPSSSVVELTGSLQRFSALTQQDKQTLKHQLDKINRFREIDRKIVTS